jgi:cytochrome c
LFGLIGRKSGTVPGYTYSSANKNAGVIWNESTLDVYLQAPHQMMPGTKMSYAGLKDPTKRADLIAFLATLK